VNKQAQDIELKSFIYKNLFSFSVE